MEQQQRRDVRPEAVLEVVASHIGISLTEITGERSLVDLGVSSFGIMRLVLALEERFDIEFSGDELKAVTRAPALAICELVQQARSSPMAN